MVAFQSLGRDSVGWDYAGQYAAADEGRVSIPRSGFCGVGRDSPRARMPPAPGFNPSVGILWGGTSRPPMVARSWFLFQSLGRDSVGWDLEESDFDALAGEFQSLGRDSVGWDLEVMGVFDDPFAVSIPRSGFCGVGPAILEMGK